MAKNDTRVLMYITADIRLEVEALAHVECRPVNHQYRVLVMEALEHRRAASVSGIRRASHQQSATMRYQGTELSDTDRHFARPMPPVRVGQQALAKRRSA